MLFTPKYTVSYHGAFHRAGTPFEIDAGDAEEMSRHGTVEAPSEPSIEAETETEQDQPVKRPGRPKKTN